MEPVPRVAKVAVDMPLAHLDRWFDYRIPDSMAGQAKPGVRVRVRFAGRAASGFISEVVDAPDGSSGELAELETVVSDEPVLTPGQVRLVRAVADHWCGTFSDVVRLAVPPRHATTEKATPSPWPLPEPPQVPLVGPLDAVQHSSGFLEALANGAGPRAYWQVPPVADPVGDWTAGLAQAVAACLLSGRRALLVVPDLRDLTRLQQTLVERFGAGTVAVLHADQGPSARYRNYLAVARGHARITIGTRSAAMAPVDDCGLVAIWDDGDDLHAEPRAPYHHARDVLAIRATQQQAGFLVAGRARSTEVQRWVDSGWLVAMAMERSALRRATPAVRVAGDSDWALDRDPLARQVRIPAAAFTTIRNGLSQGPVLVQVARAGYAVSLACQRCHAPARCTACHGPLRVTRTDGPGRRTQLECSWCGRVAAGFRCTTCRGDQLRAPLVGAQRTAEEFGRAFAGTRVVDSSRGQVVEAVDDTPALVVATPGAEPVAAGGYAAAVLLDTTLLLSRADLRASEEALRRWLNVVGLVRPGAAGGTVCAVGPAQASALQALVRLDPATLAERELQERREAGFPPAVRFVQVEGTGEGIDALVQSSRLLPEEGVLPGAQVTDPIDGLDVLGPVPIPGGTTTIGGVDEQLQRLTLRAPLEQGNELVARVRAGLGAGSARKTPPVRIRVDPNHLS
ncbi:primosomal protein N' [Aestuariimicrobium sp. Y1814]|uniref:primosomal protein N' n=1 Tax=Aestuariimicrobium sp. Y1814 TaxID=3418742 RepID=UPI003DA70A5F